LVGGAGDGGPPASMAAADRETPAMSGVGHHLTGDRHPGDTAGVLLCPERAGSARRKEVPLTHSEPGRGGTVRSRTGVQRVSPGA
jgi:hypothetical protein